MQEFDHLVDHSVDSYGTWFFGIAVPSVRPYLPSLFLPTHLLTFVSIVPFLVLCLFHTITSFFHLISTMQATANFSSSTLPLWGLQLASQKITGKKPNLTSNFVILNEYVALIAGAMPMPHVTLVGHQNALQCIAISAELGLVFSGSEGKSS